MSMLVRLYRRGVRQNFGRHHNHSGIRLSCLLDGGNVAEILQGHLRRAATLGAEPTNVCCLLQCRYPQPGNTQSPHQQRNH